MKETLVDRVDDHGERQRHQAFRTPIDQQEWTATEKDTFDIARQQYSRTDDPEESLGCPT